MSEFKDPCGMTKEEIWEGIAARNLTDPLVHAITRAGNHMNLDREHVALALAFSLLQQLEATRQEFEEWIKATPRPISITPGPEFLRFLMARKG